MLKTKIKNDLANFDNLENCHLSIQISLDSIAFSIFDKDLVDIILLHEYEFENRVKTPEQLLTKVIVIFEQESILSKKYESISVSHKNNLSAIVPNALYDKDSHSDFLKYTVKLLANDFITVDNLTDSAAKTVFIPFVNINNYLIDKLGTFNYLHSSSVLVSSLLKVFKHNLSRQFFVNVSKTSFDIVFIEDGKLQLYNNFLYYTKEDFLYYILFAMEQLQLNPDDQPIVFIGDVDKKSPLYKLTYNYIRNISFLNKPNFALSDDFYLMNPQIEKHHFFELLNQF
jgi:hypothetical protein